MTLPSAVRAAFILSAVVFASTGPVLAAEAQAVTSDAAVDKANNSSSNVAGDVWGFITEGYVRLVWEDEPKASEYQILRSDNNGAFAEVRRLPRTQAMDFIPIGESSRTMFCYRISALDSEGKPIRQYSDLCLGGKASTVEAKGFQCTQTCPVPHSVVNSMCLNDDEFATPSMSESDIASLFSYYGSFLQGTIADVDGASINPAHLIYVASQTYGINPKVLLTTLEKESGAVTRIKTRPTGSGGNQLLRCIMGYNVPNCTSTTGGASIRQQIDRAAWQLRHDVTLLNSGQPLLGGWQVGVATRSEENVAVTPKTKTVATLFSYTNVVGHWWCGESAGGNSFFCCIWSQMFNNTPQPALSVSLSATPSTGPAPLNGVTLTANVTGVPNETINYTFYCDRSDSGTDIRPGWIWKHVGLSRTQVRLPAICGYPSARTYTAKVIVEQGNGAAESRMPITVGSVSSCFSLILTVNNPNGGNTPTASPAESAGCASGQYVAGETIGLTAAPATGWKVGNWVGTQNDASTSATNSLTMPASSHTVTVNYVQAAPSPISIVTTSLPDAPPNQPYSAQLVASGGTGTGYTWSLTDGSLPAGLTLNAQTGVISGTPIQAATLSQFTIGVRDSGGNSTIRRFSLYVLPAGGLTIQSNGPSNFVFYVGTPYTTSNSLTYLATGGQAPYSWTATGLPPGLQIDAAGGFLYGTPTQTGSFQAEITATDSTGETGALSAVLTVSKTAIIITDSSGHTPPSPPPAQVGTSYQFFFNAAGGSQSGYTWSISQGNLPPGLTSQNGPGCPTYCSLEVTGTPTLAGTYTFTVAVTDSLNDHGSQVATIVVNSGTPPSIATTQLPTATIGASYSAALSATGGTPPYHWSFVGSAPDPGIQISQDGTLAGITQNTNDCPTGSSDHLGGIWVGAGYPTTYFQVIVTDAAGQSSAKQLCLVSYYPRPQVSSDNPPSITIDGQSHTITLNGGNFRSTSYIVTNGGATLPTTYIGPNALSFTLYPNYPGPLCANQNGTTCFDAGSPLAQSVIEPYSNISLTSVNLAIYNPPPTLTSVAAVLNNTNQPCTANQLCQLVVSGSGFSFHSDTNLLIVETSTSLTAALYPSNPPPWGQIITSAFSLPSGTYTLQVTNTHQAGGSDATVSATFHVN